MTESCDHNCGQCKADCKSRDLHAKLNAASSIRSVVAVASGKGGVGKSFVTASLAVLAARAGMRVGILDADVTGPSIPKSFGLHGKAQGSAAGILPEKTPLGIEVMSLNLLVEEETAPVVWRGPIIAGTVKQFWTDVAWGDLDILFVDLPPGTGDVPLTVFQSLPVDGLVVVTTPQELVGMIVEKALNMAGMMKVPVAGLVENMSFFTCPDCGREHRIFGESHIEEFAARRGIPAVARLPIDPAFAKAADEGGIERVDVPALSPIFKAILKSGAGADASPPASAG